MLYGLVMFFQLADVILSDRIGNYPEPSVHSAAYTLFPLFGALAAFCAIILICLVGGFVVASIQGQSEGNSRHRLKRIRWAGFVTILLGAASWLLFSV